MKGSGRLASDQIEVFLYDSGTRLECVVPVCGHSAGVDSSSNHRIDTSQEHIL
jgi:hypothetical protein